ncbi:MAG: sugar ABC transporter ATP-binding protein [Ignavibacteriae bacterium]|nr:sugar ABC transporter ATP-binding protein [Ignavibacteriota bacterium]
MIPLLSLHNICKEYPGVLALDDVSFELYAGEVHCLVGENGAGKSTLMKILSGAIRKNSGSTLIDGKEIEINSPIDAQKYGIGVIYQDFKLVPELTVAENILLGKEARKGNSPFIDYKKMHQVAAAVLLQLGEEIPTTLPVRELSVAQRQIVEIAKALSKKVRILAMDEPSAALTDKELKNLFRVIRGLKAEGVGIIYISHRFEEIFEIGDRVTVLRDGKFIHRCPVTEADRRSLIRWMVGRELEQEYPKVELTRGKEILRIELLNAGILQDINLILYREEIFGLAGLVGAGRSELARVIFGADPKESGKIFLEGKEVNPRSPREAIDLGIGLLTEDRNRFGLIMQMAVRENISLANLRDLLSGPFVNKAKEIAIAKKFTDGLRIKTPTVEREVESLSGGNRQKVVLARWLYTKSKLLIFDEPTAGIDIGVKYEIYNLINKLAQEGIGVIVISSELPELLGMCDRIGVMCEGQIAGILSRSDFSQEKIMMLATGGKEEVMNEG